MTTIAETLPARERLAWRVRFVLILAGLAQGAAVYAGTVKLHWLDPALLDASVTFVLSAALVVQMTWSAAETSWAARWRSLAVASLAGLLLALCHYWSAEAWRNVYFGPGQETFLALALFLSLPLLQGVVASGFQPPAYRQLFTRFVDTALALLIGAISLGLYLVLRHLWASLFDVLQLAPVELFLRGDLFTSFSDAAAWTLGILVTRESSGILDRLLRLCTALARGLLPVIVAIGGSFFLALPFTGLEPLWREGGGSCLLLGIAAFAAFLINGVYQTGNRLYPGWQRRLVEAAIIVLAVAAGLAIYGAVLRVEQHGLTPERVHLLAYAGVAVFVAGGYFIAMMVGRAWLGSLGRINIVALPSIVLLLLALTSPVLDPVGLSAWSQFRRMADGVVTADQFDFGYLRFQLGEAGEERLSALEQLSDHPEATEIRAQIAAVRHYSSYWDWKQDNRRDIVATADAVPALPRQLVSPAATTAAAQIALRKQREAVWSNDIAERVESQARNVYGPFGLRGDSEWRSESFSRLYIIVGGSARFHGRTAHIDPAKLDGRHFAYQHAYRAEPGEITVIRTNGPVAMLIVEFEPAP